jgi:hypothetical protein
MTFAHFITYATPSFKKNAELLAKSALNVGFKSAQVFSPEDIADSEFYRRNKKILEMKRGAGYWLWKPYIICEIVKNISEDEMVFYCDAGKNDYYRFTRYPESLIKACEDSEKGFLLGPIQPHVGKVINWTKRDCLTLMKVDKEPFLNNGLLATWSMWRGTQEALTFLEDWLRYCEDERCITDQPNVCGKENYLDFKDHRHDQSILSLLAYSTGATYIDLSRTLTHRILSFRPNSSIGQNFYKRPENIDRLIRLDNPLMLVCEYFRDRLAK